MASETFTTAKIRKKNVPKVKISKYFFSPPSNPHKLNANPRSNPPPRTLSTLPSRTLPVPSRAARRRPFLTPQPQPHAAF